MTCVKHFDRKLKHGHVVYSLSSMLISRQSKRPNYKAICISRHLMWLIQWFFVRKAQVLLQLKFTHDAKRNYRQIDAFGYKYFQSIRIYGLCPLVLGAVMDPIEAEPEIVAPNELHHSGWWVLIVGHISPSCIRYWVTLFIKSDIKNYIYTCKNAMKQGIRKK